MVTRIPDKREASLNRRHAVTGIAAVGIGVPLLAACGDGAETAPAPSPGTEGGTPTPQSTAPAPETEAPETEAPEEPTPAADAVARTSDVPVGGGAVVSDADLVITQPSAGEFRAFSNVCTHSGCKVTAVTTTIDCYCHGSKFSLRDGSVERGPANSPLPEVAISVEGDSIVRA